MTTLKKKPQFIVVFDCCTLRNHMNPDSAVWKEFRYLRQTGKVEVVIPRPVWDELTSFIQEKICLAEDSSEKLAKALDALVKSKVIDPQVTESAIKALNLVFSQDKVLSLQQQVTWLFRHMFGGACELPPYPQTQHANLVSRCLAQKKPFSNKDKDRGYRDALIWDTIVDLVKANPDSHIVFISSNTNDFSQGTNELHPDLLEAITLEEQRRVRYFDSMNSFLNSAVVVRPVERNDLKTSFSNSVGNAFGEAVERLTDDAEFDELSQVLAMILQKSTSRQAYEIESVFFLRILQVLELPQTDEYIVSATCVFNVTCLVSDSLAQRSTQTLKKENVPIVIALRLHYSQLLNKITNLSVSSAYEDHSFACTIKISTPTKVEAQYVASVEVPEELAGNSVTFASYAEMEQCFHELGIDEKLLPRKREQNVITVVSTPHTPHAILKKWNFFPANKVNVVREV